MGIAIVGEVPYAEGLGDKADLTLYPVDQMVISALRPKVDKLIVVILLWSSAGDHRPVPNRGSLGGCLAAGFGGGGRGRRIVGRLSIRRQTPLHLAAFKRSVADQHQ